MLWGTLFKARSCGGGWCPRSSGVCLCATTVLEVNTRKASLQEASAGCRSSWIQDPRWSAGDRGAPRFLPVWLYTYQQDVFTKLAHMQVLGVLVLTAGRVLSLAV
ncbi:hypothetical protein Z043_113762, partial [Scleropages formosus]